MKQQFFETINDSLGNVSSRRFHKEYFIKTNKIELWNWFEEQKLNFPNYSNIDIAICLKYNYISPPICIVCGNFAKVQRYSANITFNYCSKTCSLKSSERAKKVSEAKLKYSDEQKLSIENKRTQTCLEKYGVKYNSQRPEVKSIVGEKLTKRYLSQDIINKLNDKNHSQYKNHPKNMIT